MSVMPKLTLASAFLALTVLLGCDKGVEPPDDGRMILYESVDGVKLGDDASTVIRKLGQPSSIAQGDFPGVRFEYRAGKHAAMNIAIYEPTAIPSGVVSFGIWAPYAGRTKEGVGIGSLRADVLQALGPPSVHQSISDSTSWDEYNNIKILFILYYVNNHVKSIQFGWKTWPSSGGSAQQTGPPKVGVEVFNWFSVYFCLTGT